jgi:hypothetical protein
MYGDKSAGISYNLRLIIDPLKCGTVKIILNKLNKSKFYSGGNKEQIEVRECLQSFGAECVSFSLLSTNIKIKMHKSIILSVVLYG